MELIESRNRILKGSKKEEGRSRETDVKKSNLGQRRRVLRKKTWDDDLAKGVHRLCTCQKMNGEVEMGYVGHYRYIKKKHIPGTTQT